MQKKIHELANRIWGNKLEEKEINEFVTQFQAAFTPSGNVLQLSSLDNYMESFITSFDDIIFELDNEGRAVHMWAADESLVWFSKEEVLYKTTKDYLPEPLGSDLYNAFLLAQQQKMPVEIEYQSPFDENHYIARLNIIKSNTASKKHVSVLIKNVTEKRKAEVALLEATKTAEQALNAKSKFLSSVSHEIRTPMNAIAGLTDILLGQEHNEETMEYLRSIKHASDNLLIIVNDILNFSKIDEGKVQFEKIDFNLQDQIKEIQKTLGLRATDKNILLQTEISDEVPEMLTGDPYRLNQILINLVGNAIKFTEQGMVRLGVSIKFVQEHHYTLLFEIHDTGIGIPEYKQDAIFHSFTQASSDTTRRFGGTGLGLAITKSLIQQQGGSVSVKSIEGQGSTFTVELTFTKSTSENTQAPQVTFDKRLFAHLNVLIVEDNVLNQLIVKKMLDEWQATYFLANNGVEAIALMRKQTFDLVLMDLHMPEMDGFQATHAIRSKGSTVLNPDVPIIAFTADAFPETKIKVLESGMNDFVTKPFKKEELYSKMLKHAQVL